MHEMSFVINMVEMAEQSARENGAEKVTRLVLQIGELNSVVPEYVEYFFPDVTEGTMLSGAELEIEVLPAKAECRGCGAVYDWRKEKYQCPACGSEECKIVGGREFVIKEIGIVS